MGVNIPAGSDIPVEPGGTPDNAGEAATPALALGGLGAGAGAVEGPGSGAQAWHQAKQWQDRLGWTFHNWTEQSDHAGLEEGPGGSDHCLLEAMPEEKIQLAVKD